MADGIKVAPKLNKKGPNLKLTPPLMAAPLEQRPPVIPLPDETPRGQSVPDTLEPVKTVLAIDTASQVTEEAAMHTSDKQTTLIGAIDNEAKVTLSAARSELVRDKLTRTVPEPLRRRGFYSDIQDKGLFLAFAIVGFVAIFAAKSLGYQGYPTAGAAVGCLVFYAILAYRIDSFKTNPDRLGDNCYYMGFLFTLASLSAALVALQNETAGGRGDLLEALIGGFGIALFSTIGGITLRVFFMQMRHEVEDLEVELRTELERSAGLLKHELSEAVMDLENFRLRTQQVLDQQVGDAAAGFTLAATRLVEHISTAGSAYNLASEKLAANADLVAIEIGRLVNRIDRVNVPADLLTRQVDEARLRIEALATALETATEGGGKRLAALELSSKALDTLLTRMTAVAAFTDVEQASARFSEGMGKTVGKLEEIGTHLTDYARTFGTIVGQVERDGKLIAHARSTIGGDVTQSTEALHKLQNTLADVADGLVARISPPPPAVPPIETPQVP